jgi:penicillin-insensitive murein endopeptidase
VNKLLIIFTLFSTAVFAEASTCYGTTSNGRLENGAQLPSKGVNFVSYSTLAEMAGRTYVHSEVKKIMLEAYRTLSSSMPDKVFKYAETGFKEGGKFRPHKTHQNGLSVDFMTPMISDTGASIHLPTHPLNKFGYNIELNSHGHYKNLRIDYEAMAAHIVELDKAAKSSGQKIWRVIFDPELQPGLFETSFGNYLKEHIQFSKKRSWVRHDEHYHVDFEVPCK